MPLIFNCGFSRVAVKESFHKPGTTTKEADPVQRWRHYRETFGESAQSTFAVDKSTYMKKARIIYHSFRKMNSRSRTEYFKYFSLANWNGLPDSQKSEHTMSHCHACQVLRLPLSEHCQVQASKASSRSPCRKWESRKQ